MYLYLNERKILHVIPKNSLHTFTNSRKKIRQSIQY